MEWSNGHDLIIHGSSLLLKHSPRTLTITEAIIFLKYTYIYSQDETKKSVKTLVKEQPNGHDHILSSSDLKG